MFDAVIVINTVSDRNFPRNGTLKTLDALGILTAQNLISGKVIIQKDAPCLQRLEFAIRHNPPKVDRTVSYILYNQYYALQDIRYRNLSNALILEDDAFLVKNMQKSLDVLDNIPDDWDFLNFSIGSYAKYVNTPKSHKQNTEHVRKYLLNGIEHGKRFLPLETGIEYSGNTCYAVTRNFALKAVSYIENELFAKKKMIHVDKLFNSADIFPNMKLYMSSTPIMV